MNDYLMHHGVKGQKWGVRRYQYIDGSLTPLERRRRGIQDHNGVRKLADKAAITYYEKKISRINPKRVELGNSIADTYLKRDTAMYRIQSSDQFEKFAFYATYKQHDKNEYAGLFGKNLKDRANNAAKLAEREAKKTGDTNGADKARETADNMKIYQLKLSNTEKLKIPSEANAGKIVGKLLNDRDFRDNLRGSIRDTAEGMKRPSQQVLLNTALKKLDSDNRSDNDNRLIYKALNLSLTNHNDQQVAMQKKFYKAMSDHGYSALLDLNDKYYSSYHAKSPVIVFDTDRVTLQSVTQMDSKKIDKLYKKYNAERLVKEIPEQVIGNISKYSSIRIGEVSDYLQSRTEGYLDKR